MGQSQCFGGAQAGPSNVPGVLAGAAGNIPRRIRRIRLRKLRRATNRFSIDRMIGIGGSAYVYRGRLNGQAVAVKRLKPTANRDDNYEQEVGLISRLNHPNIITMLGYCAHKDEERIIVLELMPLGSLHHKLRARPVGEAALDWNTRMKIGAGIAKGLSYLHNEADPRIIYRDLKPRNVLLGEGYHPKISDFGISIAIPPDSESSTVTTVDLVGTPPYWAPEDALTDRLSFKSDVYSFGVVFLQIISGDVKLDENYPRYVSDWVMDRKNFIYQADPEMNGNYLDDELVKAMTLATLCMKPNPASRPNMIDVVRAMANLAREPNANWPEEFIIEPPPEDPPSPERRRSI